MITQTGSNHENKENNNNEPPKTDHSKEGYSIDAEVIKGIQPQIASLTQRDELKKVGAVRPYPWYEIQTHIHQSSSHQRCTSMMARACQISTFTTSDCKLVM